MFGSARKRHLSGTDLTADMGIITNEIHLLDGLKKTVLVFGADRRLSRPNGALDSVRRKLFRIPYLEAGVSYYGIPEVFPDGQAAYISQWLPDFIVFHSDVTSLEQFASRLLDELHTIMPADKLKIAPSGFHLCGYTSEGRPEFWEITNVVKSNGTTQLRDSYGELSPQFLARYGKSTESKTGGSTANERQIFTSADDPAHVTVWENFGQALGTVLGLPGLKPPGSPAQFSEWIRLRFELIAYFYKSFASQQIVNTPFDIFCLSKELK